MFAVCFFVDNLSKYYILALNLSTWPVRNSLETTDVPVRGKDVMP